MLSPTRFRFELVCSLDLARPEEPQHLVVLGGKPLVLAFRDRAGGIEFATRSRYVTLLIFQNAAISVVISSVGLYVAPRTGSASGTETGASAPERPRHWRRRAETLARPVVGYVSRSGSESRACSRP